jgi:uncharacterized protein YbjT (DUF2867 family)
MTILVTGASGFIGGELTRMLVNRDERVRVLARPTSNLGPLDVFPWKRSAADLTIPPPWPLPRRAPW